MWFEVEATVLVNGDNSGNLISTTEIDVSGQLTYLPVDRFSWSGDNSSGFTLGVKQPGQTWKQCMSANANTYSIGGSLELLGNVAAGTNLSLSKKVSFITGNGITDTLFGDPSELAKEGGLAVATAGVGSTVTWGRRTSDIMSLNLAGKGGLPKALSSSGAKGLLKSLGKALNGGLDEAEKFAADLGLAGAEAIGCSIPAGGLVPW